MTRNSILDRAEKAIFSLAYPYLYERSGHSKKHVIFVVGAPRGGTTITSGPHFVAFAVVVNGGRDRLFRSRQSLAPDQAQEEPARRGFPLGSVGRRRCFEARLRMGVQSKVLDVIYGDLVKAPEDTMCGNMDFLGLTFEPAQLRGASADADKHVNYKAFEKLRLPINAGSRDKWRQKLSDAEVARIEALVGCHIPATGSRGTLNTTLEQD